MSRPRENPRKIVKKFSAYAFFIKLENWSFRLGSKIRFQVQNRQKVLRGSLLVLQNQKVTSEPCRKMSNLSRKKSEKHFFKNRVGGKFLRIFFGFFQGLLIMMRRLSYRLSNSVVWEPQKFSIIQNNNSSLVLFPRILRSIIPESLLKHKIITNKKNN